MGKDRLVYFTPPALESIDGSVVILQPEARVTEQDLFDQKRAEWGPHVPSQAINAWVDANTTDDPGGSGKAKRLGEIDLDARRIAEDLGLL